MQLPSEYAPVLESQERMPCHLVALLPPSADYPDQETLRAKLAQSDLGVSAADPPTDKPFPSAEWQFAGKVSPQHGDEPLEFRVWAHSSERLPELFLEWAQLVPEEEADARQSRWSVAVSATLGKVPLVDYHAQLRLLSTLAPEAVMVLDQMAAATHAGAWVREVAASSVPPQPKYLYSIHAVHGDTDPRGPTWLHTHGLLRCGCIELEMLDVPAQDAGLLSELMNVVAPMFIETGIPAPGQVFEAGAGIKLVWLPWEEAVARMPVRAGGGIADRDDVHSMPSGVLMTPKAGLFRKRHHSPARYLKRLSADPLLYVSEMETMRMSLLAGERLDQFTELFATHGQDEESFAFLVKLGYPIDGAGDRGDREHLWFQVHEIGEDTVEATLINEPYGIARMHEGQRGSHSLDLLTDWSVLCKYGQFGPDTLVHLRRHLETDDGAKDAKSP